MEQFADIRKYFKPIQPSVRKEEESVGYQEFEPIAPLKNYIHCYWQLRTHTPLPQDFNYRVVSDGCIDVFFNLKDREESFLMGFCNQYRAFPIGKDFNYAGIRFYPAIFPLLFEISAKDLSNKDQFLSMILPEFSNFITDLPADFSLSIPKIDNYLCDRVAQNKKPIDDRFYKAFIEILKRKGHLEIETDLNTGLSSRQLRRWFNYYIGTSPKSFCQVVRFQYILQAKPSTQSLKGNKIFYDVGFFDQAHFIKNFTQFYGVTPGKAFP